MDITKRRYSKGWSFSYTSTKGYEKSPKNKSSKDTFTQVEVCHSNEIEISSNNLDSIFNSSTIDDTLPFNNPYSYQQISDSSVNTTKSDTAQTPLQHYEDIRELDNAITKVNYIHLFAIVIFVITLLTAIAGGLVSAAVASSLVTHLFMAGMALLSVLFPIRFIKAFRLLRYLASTGPKFLDSDNAYHEEKLKKRFRIMVNSLILFPLGALVMSIILFRKLKTPKEYIPSELNDFLRRMAGKYIIYSILMSLLWLYLCFITFPFLITVLLTLI